MDVYVVYRNDFMVDVCSSRRAASLMVRHYKKIDRIAGIKMRYYTLSWPLWKENDVKQFSEHFDYENYSALFKRKK